MIEPFEFENVLTEAVKPPTSIQSELSFQSTPLDSENKTGAGGEHISWSSNATPALDNAYKSIFQTRIGNPTYLDNHSASTLPDKVIGAGNRVVDFQTADISYIPPRQTSSELFHSYLETQATYDPPTWSGVTTPSHIRPTFPCLSPGLTSIDNRKYTANCIF